MAEIATDSMSHADTQVVEQLDHPTEDPADVRARAQYHAEAYRRVTGASSVTYREERREADGSLTVTAEATSVAHTCDLGLVHPILQSNRGTCAACPVTPAVDRYIVIGWDRRNQYTTGTRGLFEVHVEPGETAKDVQDKVADRLAEELFEHVIYTVVLEDDYRQIWRDQLDHMFGGRK
jgi:hypothetical protein